MPCDRIQNNGTNYILRTLSRIDQLQKEATMDKKCEGCEGSLVSHIYNTKPISLYMSNGNALEVEVPNNNTEKTALFRVESIQNDCVILRILYCHDNTTVCTNYTVVVNVNCICCLQCFDPICCDECTKGCGAQY